MAGKTPPLANEQPVAGNGLLHRRVFLAQGAALIGAAGLMTARPVAAAGPPDVPEWMHAPGAPLSGYGERAKYEQDVQRTPGPVPGTTGSGSSRTPLQDLEGIITPSSLHFERHHSGIPDIDPSAYRLLIHGLVRRPLIFTFDALLRYPLTSRIHYVECSGNSRPNLSPNPPAMTCGDIHGMVSGSEWTGIPVGVLLDEAGVAPNARWILAEGCDAASMSRSVPMAKVRDDALIALYQNGEHLRPSQGYPARLLLPGFEGNMNVKWLRRIKVTAQPTMTKDETSKYTDLLPSGKALQFTFPMGVKSVITSPSFGFAMHEPGLYQISGIAWSSAGPIRRVEVSADGGRSWAEAALSDPVLPKALTRFRMAWRWDGSPAVLMSRAVDDTGVQPTRSQLVAEKGLQVSYHNNSIQCWSVAANGEISNVYL
jgi:sulfane dehydrogenase subunit SoxC